MEYFRQVIRITELLRCPQKTHRSTNNIYIIYLYRNLFIYVYILYIVILYCISYLYINLSLYILHYGPVHIDMTILENADPFFKYILCSFQVFQNLLEIYNNKIIFPQNPFSHEVNLLIYLNLVFYILEM